MSRVFPHVSVKERVGLICVHETYFTATHVCCSDHLHVDQGKNATEWYRSLVICAVAVEYCEGGSNGQTGTR